MQGPKLHKSETEGRLTRRTRSYLVVAAGCGLCVVASRVYAPDLFWVRRWLGTSLAIGGVWLLVWAWHLIEGQGRP